MNCSKLLHKGAWTQQRACSLQPQLVDILKRASSLVMKCSNLLQKGSWTQQRASSLQPQLVDILKVIHKEHDIVVSKQKKIKFGSYRYFVSWIVIWVCTLRVLLSIWFKRDMIIYPPVICRPETNPPSLMQNSLYSIIKSFHQM